MLTFQAHFKSSLGQFLLPSSWNSWGLALGARKPAKISQLAPTGLQSQLDYKHMQLKNCQVHSGLYSELSLSLR